MGSASGESSSHLYRSRERDCGEMFRVLVHEVMELLTPRCTESLLQSNPISSGIELSNKKLHKGGECESEKQPFCNINRKCIIRIGGIKVQWIFPSNAPLVQPSVLIRIQNAWSAIFFGQKKHNCASMRPWKAM